jgi:hypothetical protein
MKTVIQDLKEDLEQSLVEINESFDEINNKLIRDVVKEAIRITFVEIIKRIDEELLELEQNQIEDAFCDGVDDEYEHHINNKLRKNSQQYYNEKYETIYR